MRLGQLSPQIVFSGLVDLDRDDIPRRQVFEPFINEQVSVDFGSIRLGAACGGLVIDFIHDDLQRLTNFRCQFSFGNRLSFSMKRFQRSCLTSSGT